MTSDEMEISLLLILLKMSLGRAERVLMSFRFLLMAICLDSASVHADVGLTILWLNLEYCWLFGLRLTLLFLVYTQNQILFVEDLLHPIVRNLFLHLEETLLQLRLENHCWTWQFTSSKSASDIDDK